MATPKKKLTLKEKMALKRKERQEQEKGGESDLQSSPSATPRGRRGRSAGREGASRSKQKKRFGNSEPIKETKGGARKKKGRGEAGGDASAEDADGGDNASDADSDISSIDEVHEDKGRRIGGKSKRNFIEKGYTEMAFKLNFNERAIDHPDLLVRAGFDDHKIRADRGISKVGKSLSHGASEEGFAVPNYGRSVPADALQRNQNRILREIVRHEDNLTQRGKLKQNFVHDIGELPYEPRNGTTRCPPLGSMEKNIFLTSGDLKQMSVGDSSKIKRPVRRGDSDGVGSFEIPPASRQLIPTRRLRPHTKMRSFHNDVARIRVSVGVIGFDDHPLYCEEDVLCSRLRWAYAEYVRLSQARTADNRAGRLMESIPSFIKAYKEIEDNDLHNRAIGGNLRRNCLALIEEIAMFGSDKENELEASRRVYLLWEALKAQRVSQKFTSTTLRLRIKKCEPIADEKKLVRMLQKAKETISAFLPIMEKYKAALGTMSDRLEETISRIGKTIACDANQAQTAIIVDDTASRDADETCPLYEQERRKKINKTKIYADLYLNNKKVGRTRPHTLLPSFRVNVNQTFLVDLYHEPGEAKLVVYQQGLLVGSQLGNFYLKIPGTSRNNTEFTTSASDIATSLYQFASPEIIERELAFCKKSDAVNKELSKQHQGKVKNAAVRRTSGYVGAGLQWLSSLMPDSMVPQKSDTYLLGVAGESRRRLIGGAVEGSQGKNSKSAIVNGDELLDKDMLPVVEKMPGIDPNDPGCSEAAHMMKVMANVAKTGDVFRLDHHNTCYMFSTAKKSLYKESLRTALLKLRNERPALFHGQAPIPFQDSTIKRDTKLMSILKEYSSISTKGVADEEDAETGYLEDQIKQHQLKVQNFFHRVRAAQSMLDRNSKASMAVHVNAVVKEGILPQFWKLDFGTQLSNLFAPRRKLRPRPKARQMQARPKEVYIVINLGRVYNLPVRLEDSYAGYERRRGKGRDASPRRGSRSPSPRRGSRSPQRRNNDEKDADDVEGGDDGDQEIDFLNCYAEITFQGKTVRSKCVGGKSPQFGQNFHIKLNPDGIEGTSLSPRNLVTIQDEVHIALFDKVEMHTSMQSTRSARRRDPTLRTESRFLGSFSIPFTTIYLNSQISGLVPIEKPIFNFAYNSQFADDDDAKLRIMMTTQPALQHPVDDETPPTIGEEVAIARRVDVFVRRLKKRQRLQGRNIKCMAQNIHQESLLITRFIHIQNPPPALDGRGRMKTVESVVRYVSLIPFIDDWQAFQGETEVWCTSKEFLELRAGDWEEHALLLLNYMLYLDRSNSAFEHFLVLGNAIPEGETVYVMRRKTGAIKAGGEDFDDIMLYDASSGKSYSASDSSMPLLSIGMLINEDNLWANIQDHEQPHLMLFDLQNKKQWRPFFDEKFTKPDLSTCQQEDLAYSPINFEQAERMESEITETLQQDLRQCREDEFGKHGGLSKRGGVYTRFDQSVAKAMKGTLEYLEKCSRGEEDYVEETYRQTLQSVKGLQGLASKNVHGFPVNTMFTDFKSLTEKVRATNIHLTEADDVRFSLSVRVFPYPQEVYSIWVFLLSISPRAKVV
jgi:coiled-coil and C2 domain-containing protein 2A